MNRLLLFVLLIASAGTAFRPAPMAGTLTGTWKRTAMSLVESSGKSSDMMALMNKSMPCTKDITYTFLGDGQMKTGVPESCGPMKKTIEDMNASGHWSMSGQKVTVTTTLKGIPPSVYNVTFDGNTMTWFFSFADNPQAPNPTKAKSITIVYQRI